MANIMMPPIAKSPTVGKAPEVKSQIEPDRESSFSNYMDDKLRDEQIRKRSLLGAKEKIASQKENSAAKEKEAGDPELAYLQQLMIKLQNLLDDDSGKAGEWTFDLKGSGILDKLAAYAGMDDAELALLKKQLEEKGSLGLTDLFAALEKHFGSLNQDLQVQVPETNLAFLESLLDKMGVPAEEITALSDTAVNGLSKLDIIAYLQGLTKIEGSDQKITLTDFELDQLQSMLSKAGMSGKSLNDLIPEANFQLRRSLEALGLAAEHPEVTLTVDRLQNLLKAAVADAEAVKTNSFNIPGFVDELKELLAQAGFEGKNVGWTPVVQESMTAVYQELQKMVDLAKVSIEKISETQAMEEKLTADWLNSSKKIPVAGGKKLDMAEVGFLFGSNADKGVGEEVIQAGSTSSREKPLGNFESFLSGHHDITLPSDYSSVPEVRPTLPQGRIAVEMQQFAIDQISHGVLRGLRNNQHHMTLTLYPRELGEVKVDLHVRESHVSVSFAMENSHVKETLESNMQNFRDNLQRQGFSLQECFVSVGQNNTNDSKQRFEEAWERLVSRTGYEKGIGLPADVMATVGDRHISLSQGGTISLFV